MRRLIEIVILSSFLLARVSAVDPLSYDQLIAEHIDDDGYVIIRGLYDFVTSNGWSIYSDGTWLFVKKPNSVVVGIPENFKEKKLDGVLLKAYRDNVLKKIL